MNLCVVGWRGGEEGGEGQYLASWKRRQVAESLTPYTDVALLQSDGLVASSALYPCLLFVSDLFT